LLLSAGVLFYRGFIREVLTILGVMGGALAALLFGGAIKPMVREWFGVVEGQDPGKLFDLVSMALVADISAYAMVFVGVFVLLQVASHFLASSAHAVGLGAIDRTLGVFFGVARGALLLGLVYLPFHAFLPDDNKKEWFSGSQTIFYVEGISDWMSGFLPKSEDAKKTAEKARDKLHQIDVLGDKRLSEDQKNSAAPQDGYDEKARDGLDSLIEQIKPDDKPASQRGYND
ncbi:MAG TPA: CvpA family protein, partial [Alphaproteobacteria bacterium]|nr:CvpA family protein [Alphaproteobacteria bacterium]